MALSFSKIDKLLELFSSSEDEPLEVDDDEVDGDEVDDESEEGNGNKVLKYGKGNHNIEKPKIFRKSFDKKSIKPKNENEDVKVVELQVKPIMIKDSDSESERANVGNLDNIECSNDNIKCLKDECIRSTTIEGRTKNLKKINSKPKRKIVEDDYNDSSDYGLTELPFPEKPKTYWKKTVDKYKCNQCPKKFNTNKLLDKHYTHCHAQRSLLCSKCGKVNLSFQRMRMHENNCNPDENRFCYKCNQVFKSKLIYHDHFNLVHDRKNPYKCGCGRSFMKYTKLVLHLNTFHCGTIASCTLPDYVSKEFLETFIESKNIEGENVNMDNGEKKLKFWCRICKTNSYNNRSYMAHFDREFHSNAEKLWLEEFNVEGSFECEICEHNKSVFVNISELVKHRHKHHHKCSLAAYFEKFEYAVDGEQILITEPTDYSNINSRCHICKNFFFVGRFQKHFKSFEHINLEKKWLEKYNITDFECSTCSLKYKSLSKFLIHRKAEHDEWPINRLLKSLEGETRDIIPEYLNDRINSKLIYKCSICNYFCSYKRKYVEHMLHHLPKKYIQCSCGEKFITRVKLVIHQKKRGCSKKGCKIPRFIPQIDSIINLNLI